MTGMKVPPGALRAMTILGFSGFGSAALVATLAEGAALEDPAGVLAEGAAEPQAVRIVSVASATNKRFI
jgi:hypothetical protein